MKDMGNSFQEESQNLFSLDTQAIAKPSACDIIHMHYEREIMKGLAEEGTRLHHPIKKDGTNILHHSSKLSISFQSRECDLKELFSHENQSIPAALSDGEKLNNGKKSQLAAILEFLVKKGES